MIEIIVRGVPAPQGSKRHVGNGRMVESSKAVGPWRERVASEAQLVMYNAMLPPVAGPVYVRLWFMLQRPKGHYRTGKNAHLLRDGAPRHPAGTPDLDKLIRAVLDGLTMGGAWKDDGQVIQLDTAKLYAARDAAPGCKITIMEVSAGMTLWQALGAIVLFLAALAGWSRVMWRWGGSNMREQLRLEQAERRSLRRAEARRLAYAGRHQAAPWPGPDPDTLATTGELRALAETGDIAEIRRLNAAWMRVFDLIGHARKTERAA